MAAVVRIKRHLDEDPLNILVLNCKRRKLNSSNNKDQEKSAVLQFAGTSEEENIENLLKKHSVAKAADIKEQFKKPPIDVLQKLRTQVKEQSINNRYKIVNCFRQIIKHSEETEDLKSDSEFTVFDIETDFNRNDSTANKNETVPPKYVYDFYYTSSDDLGDAELDELSVYPLMDSQHDPFIFGSVSDNGLEGQDSDGDSEDSNAECDWRNDYPDEDDLESINEDDMVDAVNNINLGEDLSSDDGEEDFVYCRYDDNEDRLRYGKLYAEFKAKNKNVDSKVLSNDLYYGDIDEDEYFH